jgi:2',3'-cyclic-nucleotide 2'-phosphodiesterase (5'-nucleotidase family)
MIYVYSGDLISPSLLSGLDEGANTIDLLDLAPPDVATPGNHEFDFGPEVFVERMGESSFQWTAVNLRGPGGQPVEGLGHEPVIIEKEGVKIGFVMAVTNDTVELATPGDWEFGDNVAESIAAADKAREMGADIVVAVVHADHADDEALVNSRKFNLVFSGHDHDFRVHWDNITGYVETSNDANYLTAVDLEVTVTPENGDTKRSVAWEPGFRFIDTKTVEPDAETMTLIDNLQADLSAELDVEIGTSTTALDSRRAMVRGQETSMGNLIADAIRAKNGADIAITNGGGIRADKEYPAGTVLTRKDVFTELPFGNVTVVTQLSGADVLAGLENGFSQMELGAGRFPQVSGLVVEVDPTKPAGSRVVSVTIGGAPLDPAKTYTLATNDYMLGGGDGFTAFGKGKVLIDAAAGSLMASDVIDYIAATGTVAPAIEGRIVIK